MEVSQFDKKGVVLWPALGGDAGLVTKVTCDPHETRITRRLARRDRRGRYHARAVAAAPITLKEVRALFEARDKKAEFRAFRARASDDNLCVLTLEYGGAPLDKVPAATAAPALGGVFAALRFLHGCGISHLDPKPENIVYNGRARLIDFGVALESGEMKFQPRSTYLYWPPDFALAPLYDKKCGCSCVLCVRNYTDVVGEDLLQYYKDQVLHHFFGKISQRDCYQRPSWDDWAELAALPTAVKPWRPEDVRARQNAWDERAALPAADVFALGVTMLNLFRRLPALEFGQIAPLIRKMTRAWYGDRIGLDAALAEYQQWLQRRRAPRPAATVVDVDCTALYE
jgi:hypothetical protein